MARNAWSDAEVSDVPSLEWSAREGAAEEILAERLAGWQERYPDVNVRRLVVWDQAARRLLNESESGSLSSWEAMAAADSPKCCSDR